MDDRQDVQVAGQVVLVDVMESLAKTRPVFHSEADFQFAFARQLFELAPQVQCRLEVPFRRDSGRAEYLDLLCHGDNGRSTAIEFKYFTRGWQGEIGGEAYALRNHAASDLARLHYVHDVSRLEGFASTHGFEGIAIMLTNESSLWSPPGTRRQTNYEAFRIHDGKELGGVLEWRNGFSANRRELRGSYDVRWSDYAVVEVGATGGTLRWTAIHVHPARLEAPAQ